MSKLARKSEPLKVIAGAPDKPLKIGDIEIPCYVLEDETRVLSQRGFTTAIGKKKRPQGGGTQTLDFLGSNNLKPFISKELLMAPNLIEFHAPKSGRKVFGYPATLLVDVCEVYLKARDAGALTAHQKHIAARAEILTRGLARTGIIALVDEATGYQHLRDKQALRKFLDAFIAENLMPWEKTFPFEFYQQIFRLKGRVMPSSKKMPQYLGHITNDIIYSRMPAGILEVLRERNPVQPSGHRASTHHQWLTPEVGRTMLKERLSGVVALMRTSADWDAFYWQLQIAYPKQNQTIPLPLPSITPT